jgi:formylglycine-generating enzyme required for sulfatase activity
MKAMKRICICFLLRFAGCQQQASDNRDEPNTELVFASSQDGAITNLFGMRFVPVAIEKSVEGHSRAFMLQTHEVTVEQYHLVLTKAKNVPAQHVDSVDSSQLIFGFETWPDAKEFAQMLSLVDTNYLYRLPTEAEWIAGCEGQFDSSPPERSDRDPVNYLGSLEKENRFGLHNMLSGFAEYTDSKFVVDADDASFKQIAEGRVAMLVMGQTAWSATLGQYQCQCDQRTPISKTATSLTVGVRLVAEVK